MNIITWIVLAMAAFSAVAKTMWSRVRSPSPDLGSVSDQWVAEHRLAQTHDAGR